MAESVGQLLRTARENLGLSLQALSRVTRIPTGSLVAIEENNFDALPAPVFVRGFIRSVCREVRLDAADMLSLYDAHIHETTMRDAPRVDDAPLAPLLFVAGGTETSRYEPHRGLQISHILLLVLALVTFIIAYVTAGMSTDKGPSTASQDTLTAPAAQQTTTADRRR
jgi:cytoskeletal protein RodZ